MPSGNVNAVAVGAVGVGLIFIWSGVKGTSVTKVVQSLIQGQQPDTSAVYPIATPTGAGSPSTADSGTGAAGGTAAQNKAIAKQLAASYGWDSGAEWDALVQLWQHESDWDNKAVNKSSGATGIPQALPASKLPKAGQAPEFNASAQIKWGLGYIKSRYGSPSKAWAAWQSRSPHWY